MKDPLSLKDAPPKEQEEWARNKGRQLWSAHGDEKVVKGMSEEENEEDKREAWFTCIDEHEQELLADLKILACTEWNPDEGVVQYDNRRLDGLWAEVETGFKQAYDESADR